MHDYASLTAQLDKVFGEFEYEGLVVVGAGDEYQRLGAIAEAGHPMVVPLRFPGKPDLSSVSGVEGVSLEDLQAWEQIVEAYEGWR